MEIRRITRAFFGGLLSNDERERLQSEILRPDPELPLGIGAVTEYKEVRK